MLKKIDEQLHAHEYKKYIISTNRELVDVAAIADYLETTPIANSARITDILGKAERIINLHNTAFEALEQQPNPENKGFSYSLPNHGFISIGSATEIILIKDKNLQDIPQEKEYLDNFFTNHTFKLYSSQEFAEKCSHLINRITAFYSPQDLLLLGKGSISVRNEGAFKNSPTNNKPIIMETEERYLATLYLKTKAHLESGYNSKTIACLSGIPTDEASGVIYQLMEEEYIKKAGAADQVAVTGKGIKYARQILKTHATTTIKFTHARYIPPGSKAANGFMYYYELAMPGKPVVNHVIAASASDLVEQQLQLSFEKGLSGERLLLLYARDRIIEKLRDGSLSANEDFIILTKDIPNLPAYSMNDTISTEEAEFMLFESTASEETAIAPHQVPDLILQTRNAINLLFKNKYKEELLLFLQPENVGDFFKDATTKEEFNARVISLGATAGEMNIELLRTITGITDTKFKSIYLLNNYLESLRADTDAIIIPLKHLVTIRNGYPAHKDKLETLNAYAQLGVDHPVIKYSESWKKILSQYLTALQKLKELITPHLLPAA